MPLFVMKPTQRLALCGLALAAASLSLSGCTKGNGNLREVLPPCTVQSDCNTDQICTNEGCAPKGCRGDYDCQTGWRCYRGADVSYCAPDDGTPPTPIDPGTTPPGDGGTTQTPDMTPGTTPNPTPGLECSASTPCASGQTCTNGRCYNTSTPSASCGVLEWSQCTSAAGCGEGRQCVAGQCLSQCTSTCGTGSVCSAGLCVQRAGSQCLWDSDCSGASRCINGTCLALCNNDTQCGSADTCIRGTCRSK